MILQGFLHPQISFAVQAFIRSSYGVLLLVLLILTLPQCRRFFLSERFGGYAESSRARDLIQSPVVMPCLMAAWFASAIFLVTGHAAVFAALVNLFLCRYFFIEMRWKGILRGMGAPGFMAYWLAALVFCLEYASVFEPTGRLRSLALLCFKIDFAVIMIDSGLYKLFSGYPQNNGMERGLVNPFWGYWWRGYQRLSPDHLLMKLFNHLAYLTEIGAGILMLIPATQELGALAILLSFLFITLNIRLGVLCEMVIISAFIYFVPGGVGDRLVGTFMGVSSPAPIAGASGIVGWINAGLAVLLWAYIILLPISKAGLYINFYAKRRLSDWLQKSLEAWTNFFGIILWRVFTVDNTNFFVRVYQETKSDGARRLYSRFGALDWMSRLRYIHVGEFICLTSVFTTLKYYPSDSDRFRDRLLRYARTVPCAAGERLVFEYVDIKKEGGRFEFVESREFLVAPDEGRLEEKFLKEGASAGDARRFTTLHEGQRPGTYAPKSSSLLKKPHLFRCGPRVVVRRTFRYVSAAHRSAPLIWGFLSRLRFFITLLGKGLPLSRNLLK